MLGVDGMRRADGVLGADRVRRADGVLRLTGC